MSDVLFDLRETVIAVTGGGGVLPGALSRGLAARGAWVALLNRTFAKAEVVAEMIRAEGGEALAADVGNRPSATATDAQAFFDLPTDELRAVIDLNLLGAMLASQVFGQLMAQHQRGSLLNLSSMAALRTLTRQAITTHTPLGRFGEPGDLLSTVIWCSRPARRLSPASSSPWPHESTTAASAADTVRDSHRSFDCETSFRAQNWCPVYL